MGEPRRDDVFERELRRALASEGGAAAGPHVDAELAAAWMERHLDAGTARSVEAHLAGCHDCQLLMATVARTALDAEEPARVRWWQRMRAGWVLPATAAAAVALVVWIAVPRQRAAPIAFEAATAPDAAQPVAPPAARDAAPPPDRMAKAAEPQRNVAAPTPSALAATPPPIEKREQFADGVARLTAPNSIEAEQAITDARRVDAATSTGQTPPDPQNRPKASAAPPAALGRLASLEGATLERRLERDVDSSALLIPGLDGARWRRSGSAFEFAPRADAGFLAATLPADPATISAGASPGGTVCWLVGRGGLVLVTADGTHFERVAAPAADDLVAVAVVAADARVATVTAANGRRFRTTDRGATWSPLP